MASEELYSEDELRERLSPEQFEVTQRAGTERAFTGVYHDCSDEGIYRCVVCAEPLFSSETKYESGTGWPSFESPIKEGAVATKQDFALGVRRVEVVCGACNAHLGHVFPDGPAPSGQRYCMNSAALLLDTEEASG